MRPDITPTEQDNERKDRQWSKLYLAVHVPLVVYQARLNEIKTSFDKVVEIIYDGGSGTLADVLPGMTLLVGTSPGASDLGVCRIRKTPTSIIFYIGEISDIRWADNCYLTVLDEFKIWPRHAQVFSDGTSQMDYDIVYSDQHTSMYPMVCMGSHFVGFLDGEIFPVFDASESYRLSSTPGISETGGTYVWTAPGASTATGLTSATPTLGYDTAGTYRVSCQVTIGGKATTSYRYVFIFDETNRPIEDFTLDECYGDAESGHWTFNLELSEPISATHNTLAILFAEDFIDGSIEPLGWDPNRSNIMAIGRITTLEIGKNSQDELAQLQVEGTLYWLERIQGFTPGVEDTKGTASAWTNFHQLTLDMFIYHVAYWRSTLYLSEDIRMTGDSRQAPEFEGSTTSLLEQTNLAAQDILARAFSDCYGRVYFLIDPQLTPVADRDQPSLAVMVTDDYENLTFNLREPEVSMLDLSGIFFESGTEGSAFFSLSPGRVFKLHGDLLTMDRLLLISQSQSNEGAGLIVGWKNRPYDGSFSLVSNNRAFDIIPLYFLVLNSSSDLLGEDYTRRILIRRIDYSMNPDMGFVEKEISFECEALPEIGITGDFPMSDLDLSIPPLPGLPPMPPIPIYTLPPTIVSTAQPKEVIGSSSTHGVFYTKTFDYAVPRYFFMKDGLLSYEVNEISELVVTPSGAIYIMTNGDSGDGWTKIYRASALGAPWVVAFDSASISSTARVTGLGVNPLAPDQVAIVAGENYINFGTLDTHRIYIGSGGSFSAQGYVRLKYAHYKKAIVFWKNNWIVGGHRPAGIGGNNAVGRWWRYTAGGTIQGDIDGIDWGSGPGVNTRDIHALSSLNLILWGGNITNDYEIFTDLAGSRISVTTGIHLQENQQMACSPTQVHGMGNDGTTPYRSTDSLATWTSMGGIIPIGSDIWESCRDENRFIWGGGYVLRLSLDQGSTYTDKEGDLITLAPLIDINLLRYIK